MKRTVVSILLLMAAFHLVAKAQAGPPEFTLPEKPYQYADPKLPPHFEPRWVKALDTTPADNPTTDAGATLGRLLFYDTRLSASNTVSCGSCHIQAHAFAEPRRVSVGHEGRKGDRNAMSLVNLRFSRAGFFWDERAETLEEAVGLPVRSRIEMAGPGGPQVVKAIAADPRYAPLFKNAFGSEEVTDERIRKALAQFIRSMISCDSKYDRGAAQVPSVKDDFPNFTAEENRGKALFLEHCNLCHHIGEGNHVAFFHMFRSLGNGLDADGSAADAGRGDITLNPTEVGLFRASSLRNIAVTAPYMHDGRFDTLEEVIDHYNSGVKRHPNAGAVFRLNLSAADKAALVAFLKTLTDETFRTDPKFSNPWKSTGPVALVEPDSAKPAAASKPLLASVSQRLANGVGLEVGEALLWLKSLDTNSDGVLNKTEIEPLLEILTRTRVATLTSGRLGRADGPRPGRERPQPAAPSTDGDFDGNGTVDDAEARAYASFKRVMELGDGANLRRAVRIDRFLSGFELSLDQAEAARRVLTASREAMTREAQAADREFMIQFEKLAGAAALTRFQTEVINRQVAQVRRRTSRDADPRPQVEREVARFDTDGDGKFAASELAELAHALDRLPGGFGQAAPPPIGMDQFTQRFVAYDPSGNGSVVVARLPERLADLAIAGDRDRNGTLSPQEIETYIRTTAFGHLLAEGIYIGGGFANTLLHHANIASELDLTTETRKEVETLFAAHEQRIKALTERGVAELFERFRAAVGNKAPKSTGRQVN